MRVKPAIATGLITLFVIIAFIGWRVYNKPHAGVSDLEPEVHITATGLFQAFQQDETMANKKFLNKVIEVTGEISSIQKVHDSKIIFLTAHQDLGGVSCKLSTNAAQKAISGKEGESLTLKGRCSGFLMDVNLVDCIIK